MGHYTGPKGRINRRLGFQVFESNGAVKSLNKRNAPPGMHTRRGKVSTYGLGLAEKQKIKYYYGLREQQLRRFFDLAQRRGGNTGEELLQICERRLDNVVRRAGFAFTRPQARQGVTHCHFTVNGRKCNKPSLLVRPGDVIKVRSRTNLENIYRTVIEQVQADQLSWLIVAPNEFRITVSGFPGPDDISLPVQSQLVVEFMTR